MRAWSVAAAVLAVAGSAEARSDEIQYGPVPAWVVAAPKPTGTVPPEGAAFQMIYADSQVRLGPDGTEYHQAYRVKILEPEALAAGNITATWSPDTDVLSVHALKIIRDGRVIDVLADTKFDILKRETNLEQAMLNGDLTAALQAPGLQVGDELEFVFTLKRRDPTLGDRAQGGLMLPSISLPGAHRVRLVWPRSKPLRWQATADLGALKPVVVGADNVLNVELRDPTMAIVADGAPGRVNLRRFIEFSSFKSWAEASNLVHPLFEQASTLAPNSPVKAEAAKIAAAAADPKARAEAALRLVQEQIRYVYVDLEGGNYRPASADETWTRKFGDCKAKTALLLALLRELGVPAEAVLVHSGGGDGTDERLPSLGSFDHVLVRAEVDGRGYWLDGTRLGDRRLDLLPQPAFAWALPVGPGEVQLERVTPEAPVLPFKGVLLEVDASAGFDTPAKVKLEQVVRGDDAIAYKTALAQLSEADAKRALKSYFDGEGYAWVDADQLAWRYDEAQNLTILTMAGEGEPEWDGDDEEGRDLDVWSAGFSPPAKYRRPKEQDQTAPWLTDFPRYTRWTTVLRLPPEAGGWKWAYRAGDVDEKMGGVAYRRFASFADGVLRTTMSRRVFKPEITAEEAQEVNRKLAGFDNKISRVWQYKPQPKTEGPEGPDVYAKLEAEAGQDPEKLAPLAFVMHERGREADALRVLDKAIALDPKSFAAVAGKAELLMRKGEFEAAVALMAPLAAAQDDPEIQVGYGGVLVRAGRKDEGVAVLEKAFAAHADDVDVLSGFAQVMREAGRPDRALAAIDAGVKLEPDSVYFRQMRITLLSQQNRWADALPDAEAALRVQPEEPANFRNRAAVLRRLGRLDEALADLDEALRINPLDEGALDAKSRVLRQLGRGAEAAALYDPVVERVRNATTLNNRCWERALAGVALEGAEADCAEAVKLEPKEAAYWDSYALVALRRGRLNEALKRYEQALTLSPNMPAALYGRGLTKLRKGDAAGGRADIAAAEALRPDVGAVLNEAGLKP